MGYQDSHFLPYKGGVREGERREGSCRDLGRGDNDLPPETEALSTAQKDFKITYFRVGV